MSSLQATRSSSPFPPTSPMQFPEEVAVESAPATQPSQGDSFEQKRSAPPVPSHPVGETLKSTGEQIVIGARAVASSTYTHLTHFVQQAQARTPAIISSVNDSWRVAADNMRVAGHQAHAKMSEFVARQQAPAVDKAVGPAKAEANPKV